MKLLIKCLLLYLIFPLSLFAQDSKPLKVGEEILKPFESLHPYPQSQTKDSEVVWQQEIKYANATYIALHFSKLELMKGDFILLKSPYSDQSWKYFDKGNTRKSFIDEGFWSVPIYGDVLIIEIHSENVKGDYYGYHIDKIARGFTDEEIETEKSICGSDNSREAKCYQSSEPNAYNKSKAVARLLINGSSACTGWLIGDEGHIMTNNHCVGSASTANNVTVEFMAEGSSCSSSCQSWFACSGSIAASSTSLVQTDVALDYSLLSLPTNVSGTYGFMQLKAAGPSVGERIYISQHPAAWGKRIAIESDHPSDSADGFAHISSTTLSGCTGAANDVGYYADTQGGSSGSPVLSYNDDLVVALHHCGGCQNKGVPIDDIITDLGSNLPNNALPASCPFFYNLTATISAAIKYEASNFIFASNTITSSANGGSGVQYDAANSVTLRPGFHAQAGCVFEAFIDGCLGARSSDLAEEDTSNDIEEALFNTPEALALTNYPNPFGNSTTIKYKIVEPTKVSLSVFNTNGQLVATLLQGEFQDKGVYQKEFNSQDLPNGIYFLRISTANANSTKRMSIQK